MSIRILRGQTWPDSGYRHQVEHTVSVLRDHPVAYANVNFQRLLHNAIRWVASDEAHDWARQQNASRDVL